MDFIAKEQSLKGGEKIAEAAGKLEGFALADFEIMTEDLDDGDKDPDKTDDFLGTTFFRTQG